MVKSDSAGDLQDRADEEVIDVVSISDGENEQGQCINPRGCFYYVITYYSQVLT